MGSEGRKSILGVGECTAEVGGLRNLGKQNSWLHGQVVGGLESPQCIRAPPTTAASPAAGIEAKPQPTPGFTLAELRADPEAKQGQVPP